MKMTPLLLVLLLGLVGPLLFCRGVRTQSGGGGKFATSLCDELIKPKGYSCIEHQAVTDDGFILGLQNIPSPRGDLHPSGGSPVLLMHGVLGGGDNFVANSPQDSLGFVLADAGFDVWIANNRAIQWSHGHQTLFPSDNAYWNWTHDELASYDLKAMTKYVYNQRNGIKLSYIGHSQGTLMLLAGLTGGKFKTEILEYLNAGVLLTPVAFISHITAPIVKVGLSIYADKILSLVGTGEFNPHIFFSIACSGPSIQTACNNIYSGLLGKDNHVNQSRLGFYTQYFPQPTSSFNVNHFGQNLRRGIFAFYSRSPGVDNPRNYDLTTFPSSLPLQLWTAGIDGLADPIDVNALLTNLPSSNTEVKTLPDYGHADFIFGGRSYMDVYPSIITFLQKLY